MGVMLLSWLFLDTLLPSAIQNEAGSQSRLAPRLAEFSRGERI
jgi:hypothetical protein